MMIQAVLSNPSHPEYGVATIPFPIPHDQYARCMELLEALEIGDAAKADCKVEKVDSFYTVLKRTEMLTVNVEELNYLAKRLDSFDTGEAAQFQAMAHKLELFELKDLINLTFCCQQATVITDFSDLAAVGRNHYMNLHGGSASVDELNALDGEETARQLIESGSGTITPYGVVYDNGMKLEQIYDGRFFPCYYYEPNAITVAVTSKSEPEDTEHITWLFLPMVQEEIDRALLRGGITDAANVRLRLEDSQLPNEVDVLLDMEYETLSDLNELAEATDGLSKADIMYIDIGPITRYIVTLNWAFFAVLLAISSVMCLLGFRFGRDIEKEAERQQTFFQNASHELKTPLMAIQGYAEGIQAGVMDAGSAAEVILTESDRMTELVEELLDISKIDMGRQLLAFSEMDIRELLYDSIRAVEPAAAGGIAIVPDFPEEPVTVSCDDTRLRRAVTNILSNGVRYARSELRLTCRADKRHVTIRIQDDGDGIAEEDLPHIFDRFYMGKSGKSGIGLALTREIIHLHKGTIRARNGDTGAVFEISIPVSR